MSEGEPAEEAPLPIREPIAAGSASAPRARNPVIKVVKGYLPSTKPNGFGDSWTCTVDGCTAKVYAASTPVSRSLITQHIQSHATDSQVRLDLVYKEERPYLPVSNLVNKIRELAARQQTEPGRADHRIAGLDACFPQPIAQRF